MMIGEREIDDLPQWSLQSTGANLLEVAQPWREGEGEDGTRKEWKGRMVGREVEKWRLWERGGLFK
jgi:hypothetical protein